LGISVRELGEPCRKPFARQQHDAGIDFAGAALSRSSVPFLDDTRDCTGGIAYDTTVAVWIIQLSSQYSETPGLAFDERCQRLRAEQRHIAEQNQRIQSQIDVGQRLLQRMPGAELRLLLDE
jgi:hypothetical protein